MIATIENMVQHYRPGVFAYSPATHEEFSADPNDYFAVDGDTPLYDALGNPCVLVTEHREYVPVTS